MIATFTSADAVTWISILVKTLAYAVTLVAAGSVMVSVTLGELTEDGRGSLRRMAVIGALAAAVLSVLRVPVRASFLMGGSLDGAVDPMMLWIVAESPLGASVVFRLIGLLLILTILLPVRGARWVAVAGAFVACASFALRGHALSEPRLLLGALVTIHIAGLAFWLGAFAPLARAARLDPPERAGALAHEFGRRALWAVGLVVLAGTITLALLGAATPSALSTAYGQMFAVKLVLFAGVLALAAVNKLTLTPALLAGASGAGARLRRAIGVEAGLVAGILVTTAALTTLSAPPGNGENAQAALYAPPQGPAHQTFGDAS
jgi:putative copper resistance protein D